MPFLTPDTTDERDALATFASQQVRQFAITLTDLDRDQLAATPTVSSMSLGALARHGIFVAERMIGAMEAAPACYPGVVRTAEQSAAEGGIQPGALRPDDSADSLQEELFTLAERARRAIRAADLDADVPVPEAPWFASAQQWNVRWTALHMTEEFARHAGHADILRETLDGKGAYALNDRVDDANAQVVA